MQATSLPAKSSVFEGVTFYHWLVLFLASCGWMFDCMGQRIFVLAREPALKELLGATATDDDVRFWGGAATFILMIGWATGGIFFGMMSDKYGRVKAMVATLLAYTIFSGLSGVARNGVEFLIYRFLCGLGVGGMFGAATTLLAESSPPRFRTLALGSMQALSAFGNILASGISIEITPGQESYWGHFSGWQVLFFVSVVPAVLAVPMLLWLREPESWKKAKAEAASGHPSKKVGSMADLFRHPRWRHSTFIGICLGVAGMVGLWGIAFFSPELITTAFKNRPLEAVEIVKPAAICLALKAASNPAVAHIKAQLSPDLLKQVEQVESGKDVPAATQEALLRDLNRLIQNGNLYNEAAFKSANLKKSTLKLVQLVQAKGEKQDINFLNRQLIEQTFPSSSGFLVGEFRGQFTTRDLIAAITANGIAVPKAPSEIESLNTLLSGSSLYSRFPRISLRKEAKDLIERESTLSSEERIELNRLILEAAYPLKCPKKAFLGAILALQNTMDRTRGWGTMLQDVGSLTGMFFFTFLASYLNRRKAFLIMFIFCMGAVAYVFYALKTEMDVYWMLPMMGFGTLSVFAGYSIYFPEIFPTRLRGTGVGFCYNTVRYLAAPFPFLLSWLGTMMPFRTVAVIMCGIYLVGIVALIWAPETKGKPLPED